MKRSLSPRKVWQKRDTDVEAFLESFGVSTDGSRGGDAVMVV